MLNKRMRRVFVLLVFAFVFMGVLYSSCTSVLAVNSSSKLSKNSWNIHFSNLKFSDCNVDNDSNAVIGSDKTSISYNVNLEKSGDVYQFTVDVSNDGLIDAVVDDISLTKLSDSQKKYIDYSVTYKDGKEIKKKDLLKSGESTTILVSVKYKTDLNKEDLPSEDDNINLGFDISYVEADID